MFGIAGTAELSTFCPGTGTWNRLQDGTDVAPAVFSSFDGTLQKLTAAKVMARIAGDGRQL